MTSELQMSVRFAIHPGKLHDFKSIAAQCVESARTKDSGTLQYDWFFNADETECVVRERYRDSAAVLEHAANLGDLMGIIASVSDPELEVFGDPSGDLVQALAALAPRYYSAYQSL